MKKLFVMISMMLGLGAAASAQSLITNEAVTREKRMVTVTFDVDSKAGRLSSKKKEVIVPYLYNGTDTVWLDAMEVYGNSRYMREKQINHINGDRNWELSGRQVMKGDKYTYCDTTEMARWMAPATLGLRRYIVGCADCSEPSDERVGEEMLLTIPPYVVADATRYWDFGQDELEIIFKVSKIEIDSTVFDNEVTFGKILTAVDKIHSNSNYKIEKIQVSGYASPEGRPGFNTWLGENRAMALIDYIIEHRPDYGLTRETFEIVNGEENWGGLRKVLVASDMDRKEEVIAIIDDADLKGEAKKLKIKNMDGGRTWQKMLEEIYPHLRSARYLSVYYDSTNDNAVETINQANALINEGRFAEAYELAITVKSDMRAYNTIGVALMGQGRFEEALPWFKKAIDSNCPSAQQNIDAINAEYGYDR
ncbi:MAG: tetratricopeptide repeat protein [Bacteroidaceae bacterium]|nr:tetratricopeptide repeat protein [Bacteroidaceae bacterium]